jgi:hypothetical protein
MEKGRLRGPAAPGSLPLGKGGFAGFAGFAGFGGEVA